MYPWDGKNIYFTGFMGTGKSAVARHFARLLGRSFFDTDALIEIEAQMTISEIFTRQGESKFREMEKQKVQRLAREKEIVVALGGGAIMDSDNWRELQKSGLTVCLFAKLDVLYERLGRKKDRPLMAGYSADALRQHIAALLAERQPFYDLATYQFESLPDKTPQQTAEEIYIALRDEI